MTDQDDLVAWLRGALDDEERIAREASGDSWRLRDHESDYWLITDGKGDVVVYDEGSPRPGQAEHIARQDPAATLARIAAHRRIVAWAEERDERFKGALGRHLLRLLASAYAHMPGHQKEWTPQ